MAILIKAMCLVVIATALVATPAESALTCGSVIQYLKPCIPYVLQGAPLGGCCGGVKGLYAAAKTTPDRQTVCNCFKNLAAQNPGAPIAKAAGVPALCGVNIPYKPTPNFNCATVK